MIFVVLKLLIHCFHIIDSLSIGSTRMTLKDLQANGYKSISGTLDIEH